MATARTVRPAHAPVPAPAGRVLLLLLGLLLGTPAAAEPKSPDAAAVQALKKAQGVLRQLAQEKAALEADKTALATDKAQLETKVQALEAAVRQLQPLQGEVARLNAGNSQLETRIGQAQTREQGLRRQHQALLGKAQALAADNQLLVQAVQEREQWIEQCGERNRHLREVGEELATHYQDKSVWQSLLESEPLTGIAQVRTESAAEDYRYRLEQLKITPFQSEAGAPAGPTAAPAEADREETGEAPAAGPAAAGEGEADGEAPP